MEKARRESREALQVRPPLEQRAREQGRMKTRSSSAPRTVILASSVIISESYFIGRFNESIFIFINLINQINLTVFINT